MFYKCSSLLKIDDISNWNTTNMIDMSYMFYECSSLKNISDISKWDTSKVTNMSNMFAKCSSLSLIPDISKWNMTNVNNISNMFNGCILLQNIPNIYNLNNNKIINIEDNLDPISIGITKKIIEQLENNIYEINIGDNNKYMGIFCKIPYLDNSMINILIINKAINIDKIKVLINNKYKEIKMEKRRKYINKQYDITIIEINEKLKINYMEYEENILNINNHKSYINKTIYTLQFDENMNKYISYGKIKDLNENYYYYKCNNKYSVLPILDILNNKMIGINIKSDNNNSKGIFINYIIDEFIINEYNEKYNINIKK
jgi:surface protein